MHFLEAYHDGEQGFDVDGAPVRQGKDDKKHYWMKRFHQQKWLRDLDYMLAPEDQDQSAYLQNYSKKQL